MKNIKYLIFLIPFVGFFYANEKTIPKGLFMYYFSALFQGVITGYCAVEIIKYIYF